MLVATLLETRRDDILNEIRLINNDKFPFAYHLLVNEYMKVLKEIEDERINNR